MKKVKGCIVLGFSFLMLTVTVGSGLIFLDSDKKEDSIAKLDKSE